MDGKRFDRLIRTMAHGRGSRRLVVAGFLGAATGVVEALRVDRVGAQEATAKRCLNEGKECKRDNQCCSGVCKQRTCRRAPGQRKCTIERDLCQGAAGTECGLTEGAGPCRCHITTAGASFCGNSADGVCFRCARDGDCDDVTGPGSFCINAVGVNCSQVCQAERAMCVPRCGVNL